MSPPTHRLVAVLAGRLAPVAVAIVALAGCTFVGGSDVTPSPPATTTPAAGLEDPADDPASARFYAQRLAWRDCGGDFQCSSLTVPLDWVQPAGQTIDIAVNRLPAEGDRIGSLVINPGGPGVSGIQFARYARQAFGRDILQHLDIVGFDPRGVGQSDPVECLPDSQLDAYVASDATPDDPGEVSSAVAQVRRFGAACVRNTGPLIRHVDTLSAARDMDVLRAALGESALIYHGASYGTFLGAWYAQTFPWRVGRMVLDGAVDPSLNSAQYVRGQAQGFNRALRAYLADCLASSGCPLRGTGQQALDEVGQMVDSADSAPLRTSSSRLLTQSLMATGIAQGLYSVQLWPQLTAGLKAALAGDGTGLLALSDLYLERDRRGHYGQVLAANPAIYCLDSPEPRTPAEIAADAAQLQRLYPPLGSTAGWGALGCAEWPVKAVLTPQRLTAPGAAPILVVGTVDDPATPYEWAKGLASQLSSGRLLTWEGHQHTAYHQGSRCIDDAVEAYLLAGTLPPAGTRCR
jgi:pimeloyl-ACP methyl ester carboxylesterase